MAENASESLPKGSRVIVTGRLEQRSWETQEGEKRSKVEVVADEIGPEPAVGDRRGAEERPPGPERWWRRGAAAAAPPAPLPTKAPAYDEEPF